MFALLLTAALGHHNTDVTVALPPQAPPVKITTRETVLGRRTVTKVVPQGYHAHAKTDGTTLLHHDSNFGDPVAHAGVAGYRWPKTALAGQVVIVTEWVPVTAEVPVSNLAPTVTTVYPLPQAPPIKATASAPVVTVSAPTYAPAYRSNCPNGQCPTASVTAQKSGLFGWRK